VKPTPLRQEYKGEETENMSDFGGEVKEANKKRWGLKKKKLKTGGQKGKGKKSGERQTSGSKLTERADFN